MVHSSPVIASRDPEYSSFIRVSVILTIAFTADIASAAADSTEREMAVCSTVNDAPRPTITLACSKVTLKRNNELLSDINIFQLPKKRIFCRKIPGLDT